MKSYFIAILALCIISCAKQDHHLSVLNPSNLPSLFIQINHNKDAVIRTPKGAVILLRKGTFTEDVELEIKEAYTMKDILLAGLATESNGESLKSGGMIYINTSDRKPVKLQKPISIAIPTITVEKGMELYKGEEQPDGTVNWVRQDSLLNKEDTIHYAEGKVVFIQNCANCHGIRKTVVGGALAYVESRGPWKNRVNLHKWVKNPGAFIPRTEYTRNLQKEYNQIMPASGISDMQIDAVFDFIRHESEQAVTDTFQLPKFKLDSITNGYTIYNDVRDTAIISNQNLSSIFNDTINFRIDTSSDPEQIQSQRNGFTDVVISNGAYGFNINTLGWFNVDAGFRGLPNTVLCTLNVQCTPYIPNLNVYAFFPKEKNLSVGVDHFNGKFKFEKWKDKIPLYLNDNGIIVAFGMKGERFYVGITSFKVKSNQNLKVQINESDKESFLKLIKDQKLDGIDMDLYRQ